MFNNTDEKAPAQGYFASRAASRDAADDDRMPRLKAQKTRFRWQWWAVIALLLALRAPSLVQPAGGDQGLYGYAGQRILAGDVMYRDVWDQKPPAIAFLYGILGHIWPGEAIAPASDLAAAAAVAWLLVILGRQTFSADVGYAAAAIFLLFGDPYLQTTERDLRSRPM